MRMAYIGAVLCSSVAIGCGGGDDGSSNADDYEGDERDVVTVVDDFANAGHDGDGEKVCDEIFAAALAKNVEKESDKEDCAAEVEENLKKDEYELDVSGVSVKGETATVDVTDQDDIESVLHLVKSGDDWRILRVTPG
jgi:hypothetical protein